MAIKDGGPAFPHDNLELGDRHLIAQPGMSLRDWFAGQAIPAVMAAKVQLALAGGKVGDADETLCAKAAYEIADEMLKARGSEQP